MAHAGGNLAGQNRHGESGNGEDGRMEEFASSLSVFFLLISRYVPRRGMASEGRRRKEVWKVESRIRSIFRLLLFLFSFSHRSSLEA